MNAEIKRIIYITHAYLPTVRYLLLAALSVLSYMSVRYFPLVVRTSLVTYIVFTSLAVYGARPDLTSLYYSSIMTYILSCVAIKLKRTTWVDGFVNGVLLSAVIIGTFIFYCVW